MDLLEIKWLGLTFLCGMVARGLGQPPLVGYLAAGFALAVFGVEGSASLEQVSALGIKLLLFVIGLKLDLRRVTRIEIWGATVVHLAVTTAGLAAVGITLASVGLPMFEGLGWGPALLLGFAVSFSSTVFVVKLLEDRDDVAAFYGRVAVGVLIVQDIVAVVFLGAADGKVPSPWAVLLLAWFWARPWVHRMLVRAGHGEVLVLAGIVLALVGSWSFELVGVKGDLGALALGVVAAGHPKSAELGKALHSIKDLFLVGFFLSVGLTGLPTAASVAAAGLLLVLAPLKALLFFVLFLALRLRARSALFASASLSNYSEFGLIVAAVAVSRGWMSSEWLVALAMAMAGSFVLGSGLSPMTYALYARFRVHLQGWQRVEPLPDERPMEATHARAMVLGMGRVGKAAYAVLAERYGDDLVGIDVDARKIEQHLKEGRKVLLASATDADFWERLALDRHRMELVVFAMSSHAENKLAIRQLRERGCDAFVAATARYPDEIEPLKEAGADLSVHVMAQAGAGMALNALSNLDDRALPSPPGRPA